MKVWCVCEGEGVYEGVVCEGVYGVRVNECVRVCVRVCEGAHVLCTCLSLATFRAFNFEQGTLRYVGMTTMFQVLWQYSSVCRPRP